MADLWLLPDGVLEWCQGSIVRKRLLCRVSYSPYNVVVDNYCKYLYTVNHVCTVQVCIVLHLLQCIRICLLQFIRMLLLKAVVHLLLLFLPQSCCDHYVSYTSIYGSLSATICIW